jgi:subtilisin family serine protease
MLLNAQRGVTSVWAIDRASAKWRVSRIDAINPGGYGSPGLADQLGLSRTFMFRVPRGTAVRQMAQEFSRLPSVELAEVDGIGGTAYSPNDPLIGECWGLNNTGQSGGTANADIDAFEAWDTYRGDSNIILAVVDSGVNTHVELTGKTVAGWNTNNNTNNTTDGLWHGTHVAGTAGAIGDNGVGIAGVSFGVRIMPVRVLSGGGSGTEAQCGAGIAWAADHGANICTMSLQYYTGSQTFEAAVDYAHGLGLLLIAATGNNQGNTVAFPARFANCYGVGATNRNDGWATFSNFGAQCDVSAPGQDVYSLYQNNGYRNLSGTSMATPHTSGLASLIWAYDRGLTGDEVFEIIRSTVDDKGAAGWDPQFGWGRISAESAILKADEPLVGFQDMTINFGQQTGGTVQDLFASDDVKVVVRGNALRSNRDVVMTVSGSAPLIPFNRLQILLEASVTIGNLGQRVELFDFVAGNWVQVDQRPATTTDSYTAIDITNQPERFLSPATNTVSARVTFDSTNAASRLWYAKVDQLRAALRMD